MKSRGYTLSDIYSLIFLERYRVNFAELCQQYQLDFNFLIVIYIYIYLISFSYSTVFIYNSIKFWGHTFSNIYLLIYFFTKERESEFLQNSAIKTGYILIFMLEYLFISFSYSKLLTSNSMKFRGYTCWNIYLFEWILQNFVNKVSQILILLCDTNIFLKLF